jgi:hypothetical protein
MFVKFAFVLNPLSLSFKSRVTDEDKFVDSLQLGILSGQLLAPELDLSNAVEIVPENFSLPSPSKNFF